MRLLQKVLVMSAAGLTGLYAYALKTIPPTVYVFVSLEDSDGAPLSLPEGWNGGNYMDDGVLRPGGTIHATDDLAEENRHNRIRLWGYRFIDGSEHAVFACRPGAEAAFASMTHEGGADEAVLQLPNVSKLIPWSMRTVRLRLPQSPAEPFGELLVTVLNADGSAPDMHPGLKLTSPIGELPLLFNFGEAFGVENRWKNGPVRHELPAGRYRVGIRQWVGITCGNLAPSVDRHLRPNIVIDVEPGRLTQVTIERPRGTHLDLDLTFTGDGGEFAAAREGFLDEWEDLAFDRDLIPRHRWRAEAWLQRLDHHGESVGRRQRYACGWDECRYMVDRHSFPVSGLIGGLRQYPPGRYRLTLHGEGLEPLTEDLHIPGLDGGSLVFCLQLTAASTP